jgi:heme/copper-type cytochrome/quinol oxidase subunit 4
LTKKGKAEKEKEGFRIVYRRSITFIMILASLWILHELVYFLNLTLKFDNMTLTDFLANSIFVIWIAVAAIWVLDFIQKIPDEFWEV